MPNAPAPPEAPWPEYPRPQFRRPRWASLNGEWEFAFDDAGTGLTDGWWDGRPLAPLLHAAPGRITVPFPYQSRLSGIGDTSVHEVVWYARDFTIPPDWAGDDVLLHFGAVDYRATIWINGQEAAHNRGGHVPFSVDVAPYLHQAGPPNRVVVRVEDRQSPHQPRGKQAVSAVPGGIDYHCSSGIWQTVWLEPVPQLRIDHLAITSEPEAETIEIG